MTNEEILRAQQELLRMEQRRDALLRNLMPGEQAYLTAVMREWLSNPSTLAGGPSRPRVILAAHDYERLPVPVRQFIFDKQYLGSALGESIFPKLVDDLEELFAGNYSEVVLGGAIGWGKTTFAVVSVAYDIYRLSCLKDPAVAYGMKPGSNMTFVNVSVDKTQAQKVFFQDLFNMIKVSPYFNDIFRYDKRLKASIEFPKSVRCYAVAASEQAALGVGVFCACIDEANFMPVVERSKRTVPGQSGLYDQAEKVFNKLKQRMRSRMNQRGKLPGRITIMSSARYPGDLTERMEAQARKEAAEGKHLMFVRHYSHWDTRPKSVYMTERFKVEVGDLTRGSRVLDGTESNVTGLVVEVPWTSSASSTRIRTPACVIIAASRPYRSAPSCRVAS